MSVEVEKVGYPSAEEIARSAVVLAKTEMFYTQSNEFEIYEAAKKKLPLMDPRAYSDTIAIICDILGL